VHHQIGTQETDNYGGFWMSGNATGRLEAMTQASQEKMETNREEMLMK
jgi:hypothetical protein